MTIFSKSNIIKILTAILAWIITVLCWFFPQVLNNSSIPLSSSTIHTNAIASLILAIILSYFVVKNIKNNGVTSKTRR